MVHASTQIAFYLTKFGMPTVLKASYDRRLYVHSPHASPVSPEVTVCWMGLDSHTTGPLDHTDLCMCEASWTPFCTVHLKFGNI